MERVAARVQRRYETQPVHLTRTLYGERKERAAGLPVGRLGGGVEKNRNNPALGAASTRAGHRGGTRVLVLPPLNATSRLARPIKRGPAAASSRLFVRCSTTFINAVRVNTYTRLIAMVRVT